MARPTSTGDGPGNRRPTNIDTSRRIGEARPTSIHGRGGPCPAPGSPEREKLHLALEAKLGEGWKIEDTIETGGEGEIFLVSRGNEKRAVKVYSPGRRPQPEILHFLNNTESRSVVRRYSDGVITLRGGHEDVERFYEMMEYCAEGSLRDLLKREGKLSSEQAEVVLRALAAIVDDIHTLHTPDAKQAPIAHRDIKPGNILIRTKTPLELCLTDFGISEMLDAEEIEATSEHSTEYAPPESRRNRTSAASDWWSVGMIMVEALAGRHPMHGQTLGVMFDRLLQYDAEQFVVDVMDTRWRLACRGLLRSRREDRWTIADIREWLAGGKPQVKPEPTGLPPYYSTNLKRQFETPTDLAIAMRDLKTGRALVGREDALISNWIGKTDNEAENKLKQISERTGTSLDERVTRFMAVLLPGDIPHFLHYQLSPAELKKFAVEAFADREGGDLRKSLQTLFDSRLLATLDSAVGHGTRNAIQTTWEAQMKIYAHMSGTSLAGPVLEPLRPKALAAMLRAAIPAEAPYVARLELDGNRVREAAFRRYPWLRTVAPTGRSPTAFNFILTELASN